MPQNDSDPINENFSDDPLENLRFENDILKLQLQAQFGAITETEPELPPEMENEFLQNVQRFEEAWKDVKLIKVYDLLGRPAFQRVESLSPENIKVELARIEELLAEKNIFLDVLGEYETSTIYRFITGELFEHETSNIQLEGFHHNFIYEEFHPNHRMDLEENTEDFFKHWFERKFDDYSMELSQTMITMDGSQFTFEEMISKLNNTLACFTSFSNVKYKILDTSFEWKRPEDQGMGYTEGVVTYDAEIEGSEGVNINGPFKFYFCNEHGYWHIYYFIFPGFEW